MAMVTVHEAKTHLSKLIARAEAGEEVVIARGKAPAVKLVAVTPPALGPRVLGGYEGTVVEQPGVWDPMSDEELDELGL